MKKTISLFLLAAFSLLPVSQYAHSATKKPSGKPAFAFGKWSVEAKNDEMTDKLTCTAVYKNDWTVQASTSQFFISYKSRGGIRGYQVRIDNQEADDYQNADETEKAISAAAFAQYFDRIYAAKRLRVRTSTLVNGSVTEDIDLTGFKEAVDYMRAKQC